MIELQQVSFAYPSRHPLFQDFNLSCISSSESSNWHQCEHEAH